MTSSSVPNPPTRRLTSFKVLTLDIYGTLIDWESGIQDALQPIVSRLPESHPLKASNDAEENKVAVAKAFVRVEQVLLQEKPGLRYSALLAESYVILARQLGLLSEGNSGNSEQTFEQESKAFAGTIGTWSPFPDTIDAMNRLHKHFKLVPLSNVDNESFRKTCGGPLKDIDPGFDAIYTAQDIGSYKPSHKNFDYLFDHLKQDFGLEKDDILHTAQSLPADHVPAKQLGLTSAWIARGPGGKTGMGGDPVEFLREESVGYSWRFSSLGEMADAVEGELQ
ncbi:Fc.00g111750.m01.CDS01 [Cosmosporella sp. VM-42]